MRGRKRNDGVLAPPKIASSVLWSLIGGLLWILLVWAGDLVVQITAGKTQIEGVKIGHVILGGVWILIGLYSVWAWQPRRKNAEWHRWWLALLFVLYPSGMWVILAILLWNTLLSSPWDRVISVFMVLSYCVVWWIPALFSSLEKQLMRAHYSLDLLILRWGGISVLVTVGIISANFGLRGEDERPLILAILSTICPVGWAQYAMSILWPYRPWAKEEGE